jgi:hypothetical protein
MARFHGTPLMTSWERGCIDVENIAIGTVDILIFNPRPSWEHHQFADEAVKRHLGLLASENATGCTANLTVESAYELTNVKQILARTP